MGRFINADAYASTGQGVLGNNMFAYCLNSPTCMIDIDGRDAIYVVDTSADEGLPVVGHAIVYIQDDDGNWYKSEYAGTFPDKSTAHVRTMLVSAEDINKILNGDAGNNIFYVYISGDFSNSLDKALSYTGTNFSGYNLFFNNCLHYAKEILFEGSFDSSLMRMTLFGNNNPIPMKLHGELSCASLIVSTWREISNEAKDIWNSVTEFFD